jgi:cysteinyl-tRNA synthetase
MTVSVLKLKNSYTRQLEVFEPLMLGRVTMYSCGPTVYSFAHIGNFRSFLFADVLRRVLERNGYEVRHVMNITDVGHMTEDHLADASGEDKLAKAARELGSDPFKVAQHFERAFVEDAKALRLKIYRGGETDDPELHPRATGHIPEMLAMIQKLLERGYAYVVPTGEVYFSVAKFPEYGQLSGKNIEENEAGARVGVREEKKDPRDFALWKVDAKHLMQWDPHSEKGWDKADYARYRELAPSGVDKGIKAGFPGWHIECSAMSRAHLGSTIDIHTGGEDNMFPHHECEIAQSYGAFGFTVPGPHGASDEHNARKTFSRYWVHARHLLVEGGKMSKRDGTFFTVRNLTNPFGTRKPALGNELKRLNFRFGRVSASVLRFALISNQYSQPMNFTLDLLAQAKASVERIQRCYERLREILGPGTDLDIAETASDKMIELVDKYEREFDDALNDNLNTPNALAAVFKAINEINAMTLGKAEAVEAMRLMDSFDEVLDVIDRRERSGILTKAEIEQRLALPLPEFESMANAELDFAAVAGFVALRQAARKAKDFERGDAIRDGLKQRGVMIEDVTQGVRWKLE